MTGGDIFGCQVKLCMRHVVVTGHVVTMLVHSTLIRRPPLLASTFLGNVGHGSKDESRVTLHVSSRDDVSCR